MKVKIGVVEGVHTKGYDDGHLQDVIGVNLNLVISLQQVELPEDLCFVRFGGYVSHAEKGVVVRFNDHVKMAVIIAGTVIFPDKEKEIDP